MILIYIYDVQYIVQQKTFTFTGINGKYVLDENTNRVTSVTIGDVSLYPDENNETTYIANGRVPIGFLRKLKDIDPNCKRIVYRLKPLERWTTKDKTIYLDSQSFEFNNQVGVIDMGLNGNYSVMWVLIFMIVQKCMENLVVSQKWLLRTS